MKNLRILFALLSLGLLSVIAQSNAALVDPLTTIELDTPVYFLAPDGSNVLIQPGTYIVEAAEEWLRVIPGKRRDALLLKAMRTQHNEDLRSAKAVYQYGEADEYRIVLLLPGGKGLEAIGSVSGIRSRAVRRPPTSRKRTQQQQASRIPTQSKKSTVIKNSKPIPKSPSQPNNILTQRLQTLEQQVSSLQTLVSTLQSQLTKMTSAIQVDNAGNVTITQSGKFTVNATTVDISAGSINAHAGMSKFSGVVKADTVITNSVASKSYTPGAGNIW